MTRLLLLAALAGCGPPPSAARAVSGELDLWAWDPAADGPAPLSGQWAFYWGQLLGPTDLVEGQPPPAFVAVPGAWDARGAAEGPTGVATYRLRVLLPPHAPPMALEIDGAHTAYRLWVNGQAHPTVGQVEPRAERVRAEVRSTLHPVPGGVESLDVLVQVANQAHRVGGLRRAPTLGTLDALQRQRQGLLFKDALALVTLLLVGATFTGLFTLHRKDPQRAWFGPFCLLLGLRSAVGGDARLALLAWPEAPWAWLLGVEYAASFLALACLMAMFAGMYPQEDRPRLRRAIAAACAGMGGLALTLEPLAVSRSVGALHALSALATLLVGVQLLAAVAARRPGALSSLAAAGVFVLGVLHDALMARGLLAGRAQLAATAFLVFVLAQGWALVRAFAASYDTIEGLSGRLLAAHRDLEATHAAVQRFVPFEFLRLLRKQSVRDIRRGDHVSLEMEVLFCDLRAFTSLVEARAPAAAFRFINAWLSHMEPAVHAHGGFINQYLGDCIMALFPTGADAAVASALDMARALETFNAAQREAGDVEVAVSLGLSSGRLMLGTIGGMDRLDSGVIGDPVNLAARLESLNRLYGTVMILSERTLARVQDPSRFTLRELDQVIVKGKSEPIRIFEVLDALPEPRRARRMATREAFALGLAAWRARRLDEAQDRFAECLDAEPEDAAARLYLDRLADQARSRTPPGWTGVTIMSQK